MVEKNRGYAHFHVAEPVETSDLEIGHANPSLAAGVFRAAYGWAENIQGHVLLRKRTAGPHFALASKPSLRYGTCALHGTWTVAALALNSQTL